MIIVLWENTVHDIFFNIKASDSFSVVFDNNFLRKFGFSDKFLTELF